MRRLLRATLTELAPGAVVRSGDFISIRPRHVMTHDNTGAVIPKFKQIGATSIADPGRPASPMPATTDPLDARVGSG